MTKLKAPHFHQDYQFQPQINANLKTTQDTLAAKQNLGNFLTLCDQHSCAMTTAHRVRGGGKLDQRESMGQKSPKIVLKNVTMLSLRADLPQKISTLCNCTLRNLDLESSGPFHRTEMIPGKMVTFLKSRS